MKKSILATIRYTIDKKHKDYNCMLPYPSETEITSYTDVYSFDTEYYGNLTYEEMENYAKHDLKLIAGGGYDWKHVHNIQFEFSRNQKDIDEFINRVRTGNF